MGKILEQYLKILGIDEIPLFLNKYLEVPSLVRLKNICYFCGMDYASRDVYDFGEHISRFDHSLNVALITWKFTKDKSATIAGLFHDISTPCFSHAIDYMNKDYSTQESTEEYTEEIMKNDKYLIQYLKKDNLCIDDIDFKKYSIVDNNRPKLCADRLDGVILTGLYWTNTLNIDYVKKIIEDTSLYFNEEEKEELGFKSKDVAELICITNEKIDNLCHSKEDNYMMELLASITREAIKTKIISYDDLYKLNEVELMNILENCNNDDILNKLAHFKKVKLCDIPNYLISNVKRRNLNPLVNGKRFK